MSLYTGTIQEACMFVVEACCLDLWHEMTLVLRVRDNIKYEQANALWRTHFFKGLAKPWIISYFHQQYFGSIGLLRQDCFSVQKEAFLEGGTHIHSWYHLCFNVLRSFRYHTKLDVNQGFATRVGLEKTWSGSWMCHFELILLICVFAFIWLVKGTQVHDFCIG